MNKKRLIIIIGIVVGLIIVGLAVFFLTKSTETEQPTGQSFLSFLFPSIEDKNFAAPTTATSGTAETEGPAAATEMQIGQLIQLTSAPIAGAAFNSASGRVRYIDKTTGHLYETGPSGGEQKEISITTIPKIFEVFWSKNADGAALRYPDHFFLVPKLATTTEGIFLPLNTAAAAFSPEEDKIFYLVTDDNGSQAILASSENKNPKTILSLPFDDFLARWPQKNLITLLTKPSFAAEGYFYSFNPQTKSLNKIIGGIKGLTALYSPTGNKVIYSQSHDKKISAKIYDTKKKILSDLGITTLPEKCVFSQKDENKVYCSVPFFLGQADYPDDWYKGIISFEDYLWSVDLSAGSTKIISDQGGFDATNLFLSSNEDYLFFTNKKDSTLWSLRLE